MSKRPAEENSHLSPGKHLCLGKTETQSQKVLQELSLLFPQEKFCKRVPQVVMKHMVYSHVTNRTKVDKEIVSFYSFKNLKRLIFNIFKAAQIFIFHIFLAG